MIDKEKNENPEYTLLKSNIKKLLSFESEQYTDSFLLRRIQIRMRARNINNFSDYEKLFREDKHEQEELLKNLTIHVTEFFRDKSFWDFNKQTFFPDAIRILDKKGTINIWSAGCSSGQEAVSILITFLEINPDFKNKVKITCTDISSDILKKAENFEYEEPFETKGLAHEIISRYFIKKDNKLMLKDEYRQNFKFQKHDILAEQLLKDIDMMFLRNTVIYFSKESKDRLYERVYDGINTPGFFILGKTEILTGPAREKFKVYDSKERIFRKE